MTLFFLLKEAKRIVLINPNYTQEHFHSSESPSQRLAISHQRICPSCHIYFGLIAGSCFFKKSGFIVATKH